MEKAQPRKPVVKNAQFDLLSVACCANKKAGRFLIDEQRTELRVQPLPAPFRSWIVGSCQYRSAADSKVENGRGLEAHQFVSIFMDAVRCWSTQMYSHLQNASMQVCQRQIRACAEKFLTSSGLDSDPDIPQHQAFHLFNTVLGEPVPP